MDERTETKETIRTEGFSDGIFAIALTLLTLDLKVPHLLDASVSDLASALREEAVPFLGFVVSFATIFIMWVNHHRLFGLLHHMDGRIMASNGLLLVLV